MHAQEQWIPLPQDGMSLVMYVPASERERERLRRVVAEPFGGEMGTALGPTRGAAISSHAYRLTRCAVEHAAIRNARPNPCSWTSDPSAVWLGIIGTKNQKLSGSASRCRRLAAAAWYALVGMWVRGMQLVSVALFNQHQHEDPLNLRRYCIAVSPGRLRVHRWCIVPGGGHAASSKLQCACCCPRAWCTLSSGMSKADLISSKLGCMVGEAAQAGPDESAWSLQAVKHQVMRRLVGGSSGGPCVTYKRPQLHLPHVFQYR